MSRLAKAIVLGLITGVAGMMLSFIPFGLDVEESIGLSMLFNLRGARKAPAEVVVVGIDKESADVLNLTGDPRKCSRSLHARFADNLICAGASVLAFDMTFDERGSAERGDAMT